MGKRTNLTILSINKAPKEIGDLVIGLWGMYSEAGYEAVLVILVAKVADYVEAHPELREQPTEDMWSFRDPDEDVVPRACASPRSVYLSGRLDSH